MSIKFSPDGAGHETLTASISETNGRSASVTLLSWTEASSYENRSADVSCVMIGNTMMVCAESYSAGTLATSYSSEFKAVYYNGVAFGNYYSYNNSGSSFSADEVSSAIAGFQNAGFNVTTTKLFSWGQSSFVAEQLNGVNICGVTIRFTGADGELYAFASGQLAYVRPFEYVIQGSIASNVAPTIDVLLNGVALSFDQPPVMEGDRVLVPLRTIFEALGYQVEWYSDTQTAIASNGSRTIIAQINNPQIVHSSGTYLCDVSPKIISGRTLVPVRAISECAGCSVLWNGDTQTVSIYS